MYSAYRTEVKTKCTESRAIRCAMTSISKRLRLARERAGYARPIDASRAFGWNEHTYRSHENGTRGFAIKTARKYAAAFRVSMEWLTTGLDKSSGAVQHESVISLPLLEFNDLPRLRGELTEALLTADFESTIPAPAHIDGPDAFAVQIPDDSMVDERSTKTSIWPGDVALISPTEGVKPGRLVMVYNPQTQEHSIRRARRLDDVTWQFVPANTDYAPFTLPISSEHIIGVVKMVMRTLD